MDNALTPILLVAPAIAFGILVLAIRAAKRIRLDRAQRLLDMVDNGDAATAEVQLRTALRNGFVTPHDRAALLIDLAGILQRRGDLAAALDHLAEGEAAPHRDSLDPQIARLEEQLREA